MAYPTTWPQPKKDAMMALARLKEALRRQTIAGEPNLTTTGPGFAEQNISGLYGMGPRSEYDDPIPISRPPRPLVGRVNYRKRIAQSRGY